MAGVRQEVERMRGGAQKVSQNTVCGPSGEQHFKADAQRQPLCGHLN